MQSYSVSIYGLVRLDSCYQLYPIITHILMGMRDVAAAGVPVRPQYSFDDDYIPFDRSDSERQTRISNNTRKLTKSKKRTKALLTAETENEIVAAFCEAVDVMAADEGIAYQCQDAVDRFLAIKADEDADGIDTTGAMLDCLDEIAGIIDLHTAADGYQKSMLVQMAALMLVKRLGLKFEGPPSDEAREIADMDEGIANDLDADAYAATVTGSKDDERE